MSFENYKIVLYRQEDGSWVAEIPTFRVATHCPRAKRRWRSLQASFT
jgi:hypothetical protein